MPTVPLSSSMTSTGPASPASPAPCRRFAWCLSRVPGHSVHQSDPVPLLGGGDRVLFAETDPGTGHLLYGPVLGGEDADEPVRHARMLAAQLRVAAARLDEMAATSCDEWTESPTCSR